MRSNSVGDSRDANMRFEQHWEHLESKPTMCKPPVKFYRRSVKKSIKSSLKKVRHSVSKHASDQVEGKPRSVHRPSERDGKSLFCKKAPKSESFSEFLRSIGWESQGEVQKHFPDTAPIVPIKAEESIRNELAQSDNIASFEAQYPDFEYEKECERLRSVLAESGSRAYSESDSDTASSVVTRLSLPPFGPHRIANNLNNITKSNREALSNLPFATIFPLDKF